MDRVTLDANDQVEASFSGGASTGNMKSLPVFAEFQHFSGDEDAAASGTCGQGADHGAQGLGVGVVAIIQDGCAVDLEHLSALVSRCEFFKRGDSIGERNACFKRNCKSRHGVGRVVCAEKMQSQLAFMFSGTVFDVQAVEVFLWIEALRIGAGT